MEAVFIKDGGPSQTFVNSTVQRKAHGAIDGTLKGCWRIRGGTLECAKQARGVHF